MIRLIVKGEREEGKKEVVREKKGKGLYKYEGKKDRENIGKEGG